MSVPLAAEFELFHTRPTVATRRLALGHLVLPTDPAPGAGALLLAAVVARSIARVDVELRFDIACLVDEVAAGERIVQPRLRHRYQVDHVGLAVSRHRLYGGVDQVEFDFDQRGTDLVQVLGAIYALERLDATARSDGAELVRRALRYQGEVGAPLIRFLLGDDGTDEHLLVDPRGWALALLGFQRDAGPSTREVRQAYRAKLRDAHPDLGGAAHQAARAIDDLNHARRILSDAS